MSVLGGGVAGNEQGTYTSVSQALQAIANGGRTNFQTGGMISPASVTGSDGNYLATGTQQDVNPWGGATPNGSVQSEKITDTGGKVTQGPVGAIQGALSSAPSWWNATGLPMIEMAGAAFGGAELAAYADAGTVAGTVGSDAASGGAVADTGFGAMPEAPAGTGIDPAGTVGNAFAAPSGAGASVDDTSLISQAQQGYKQLTNNPIYQGYKVASTVNSINSALGGGGQSMNPSATNPAATGSQTTSDPLSSLITGGLGVAGGIAGIATAGSNAKQAATIADPNMPYQGTYAKDLNSLVADPSSILNSPIYQASQAQANQSTEAIAAAQGQNLSGGELNALQTNDMAMGAGFANNQEQMLLQATGKETGTGQAASITAGVGQQIQGFGNSLGSGINSLLGGLNGLGGLSGIWNSISGNNTPSPDSTIDPSFSGTISNTGLNSNDVQGLFGVAGYG